MGPSPYHERLNMGQRGNGHGCYRRNDRHDQRSERYDERRECRLIPRPETVLGSGANIPDHLPRARPVAATPNQERYHRALKQNDVTVCTGPAGSGKTFLAVGEAIHQLLSRPDGPIQKILLVRPLIAAVGEENGFLPGDIFSLDGPSKAGPYMRPVLHAMEKFTHGREEVSKLFKHGLIEVVPLAYLRGATFDNTFMILDEAQNTTEDAMKMFVTRIGKESRIAISGDPGQSDIAPDRPNGLTKATDVFGRIGGWRTGKAAVCRLTNDDIQRSPFMAEILDAWENPAELELLPVNGYTIGGPGDGDPRRISIG